MIEVSLIALLMATNIFWAYVCLKLTNRLMSRSYHEYAMAEKKPVKRAVVENSPEVDEFAESQARQLNALMGTT